PAIVLAVRVVHGMQRPRQPPAAALNHDHAQVWKPREYAGGAEVGDGLHWAADRDDVIDDRAARAVRRRLAAAGAGMEGKRQAQLLRRRPQRLVRGVVVW